jgi:hypothetical protein
MRNFVSARRQFAAIHCGKIGSSQSPTQAGADGPQRDKQINAEVIRVGEAKSDVDRRPRPIGRRSARDNETVADFATNRLPLAAGDALKREHFLLGQRPFDRAGPVRPL